MRERFLYVKTLQRRRRYRTTRGGVLTLTGGSGSECTGGSKRW